MTRRTAADWLSDILLWGERLRGHLAGIDRDTFFASEMVQDAVSKCAEAIGEAAGQLDDLDPTIGERFDLRLKEARRARNRLSHGYYQIDRQVLWVTVTESIPTIVAAAKRAKESYPG